ncbi:glycosyltransferase family 2 protein [Tessaracoccus sp. G1721]
METVEGTVPLVSVVVPCYRMGARLDETIASVSAQRYPRIQLVIVNDGSTDEETLLALERAQAQGAAVVEQENRGVGAALNTGIRASSGKYFIPLGDDIIDPPYIAEAVGVLESDPSVGIVYCNASFFGATNGDWTLPEFSIKTQLFENCIFAPSLYRRADFDAVGGMDEQMVGLEDYDFVTKIVSLGRTVHKLPGKYFHYRRGDDSLNDRVVSDRRREVDAHAAVIRNNIGFYRDNAELILEYVMDLRLEADRLARERDRLLSRYAALERLRLSRAWNVVQRVRELTRGLIPARVRR